MLYHGSKHLIEGELEPRISLDFISHVYATDDYFYALVRSGNFNTDRLMTVKEDYEGVDKPFRLIEITPGAFEYLFDVKGYIYEVDEGDFNYNHTNEYISDNPVKIKNRIEIPNVFEEMKKHPEHYELIRFEDADEYWTTVRGGKEGYMERRMSRYLKLKGLV